MDCFFLQSHSEHLGYISKVVEQKYPSLRITGEAPAKKMSLRMCMMQGSFGSPNHHL